jgi:putative selenium metabolism protein SsnA
MSSLLIKNGRIVTMNDKAEVIDQGSVLIEGTQIKAVGKLTGAQAKADKIIDAGGKLVMPGLINCHHHLYSTFARGFIPPGEPARNFKEILERLWWKLDLALDEGDVYYSAMIPLIAGIREGCTTIIDHHASPSCTAGSLDVIEKAFRETGVNGCLCYEVSDRNRKGDGVRENERFIKKCQKSGDDQIRPLFGLHASCTLDTDTLEECADIGHRLGVGFHCHAAEAEMDDEITIAKYGKRLSERFLDYGIVGEKSIMVHGVHFTPREMEVMKSTDTMLVYNPESNMNNGLGVAPLPEMHRRGILIGLGTDGMSSHMISQARAMYMIQRGFWRDPRIFFVEAAEILLKNNRAICGRIFKEPRGALAPGHLADVIIVDYIPFTPLNNNNFYGHLLFGLSYARVDSTICRGKTLMEGGRIEHVDEVGIRRKAAERAPKLWKRIT